ncbi:MAG: YifB family Mg chelatase-like AAA ATPase [Helicobacteraceae bacterium]|jgi:magnesium chelatase family protein|nr:YifB family Mg chelatase-like AAA ATPase [Helicobacteraceae bacterium]
MNDEDLDFSGLKRFKRLKSATLDSAFAREVTLEASFTRGLPSFSVVGLADEAIREAKDRVKSALLLSGYQFPPLKVTVNLSPGDLRKSGSQMDLPIALIIALQNKPIDFGDFFCFAELGLDGQTRSSPTTFALALSLASQGLLKRVVTDPVSAQELARIPRVEAYAVRTLNEAIGFFSGANKIAPATSAALNAKTITIDQTYYYEEETSLDFLEVRGQKQAKRAALIAAAGFHNILFSGAPGTGKSMIIKRIAGILPPVSLSELLNIASLESLEGKTPSFKAARPLRNPHHTATRSSIFGGGSKESKMGETALANGGILFFDELPHFSKSILEAMREPLEDHRLLISRVNSKIVYETRFLFAAAMNPCPCGNLYSKRRECRCSQIEIERYQARLSDPFLDRIDLFTQMSDGEIDDEKGVTSAELRSLTLKAFVMQKKRGQTQLNGKLSDAETERYCIFDRQAEDTLTQAVQRFALSRRAIGKIRRVARTIADLDETETIDKRRLLEALSFRKR